MGLIRPLVESLAKKLKISPELAMIVVSFILQKLLAHHHTSGRNSAQFNIDELFNQLGSGKLAPNMIRHSGMVNELCASLAWIRHRCEEPKHGFHDGGQSGLESRWTNHHETCRANVEECGFVGKKDHALKLKNQQKTASEWTQFFCWLLAEDLNL